MRTVRRPRRYVGQHWLTVLTPVYQYNHSRDAYLLRGVGRHVGPVLRPNRRVSREQPSNGVDRRAGRHTSLA